MSMLLKHLQEQPRGQVIAQVMALIGFLLLTVLAVFNENVLFAPLFFLLFIYYLRKLFIKGSTVRATSSLPMTNTTEQRKDLTEMLLYYKLLLKNWKWIALFGWALSITLLIYAPSPVLLITIGISGYSTYALVRCRQAVRRIEMSPIFKLGGGKATKAV